MHTRKQESVKLDQHLTGLFLFFFHKLFNHGMLGVFCNVLRSDIFVDSIGIVFALSFSFHIKITSLWVRSTRYGIFYL